MTFMGQGRHTLRSVSTQHRNEIMRPTYETVDKKVHILLVKVSHLQHINTVYGNASMQTYRETK